MPVIVSNATVALHSVAPSQPYTPLFFQCPDVAPRAVCPTGFAFNNQQTLSEYQDLLALDPTSPDFVNQLVENMLLKAIDYTKKTWIGDELRLSAPIFVGKVLEAFDAQLKQIGVNELSKDWSQFIIAVAEACFMGAVGSINEGRCTEAAAMSIVHSLQRQLNWGFRESVAQVELHQEDHTFVIYNADVQALNKANIHTTAELNTFLAELQPQDAQRPVVVCDAWISYNGPASGWLKHYEKHIGFDSGLTKDPEAPFMKIRDFSIPSFRKSRDEFNAKTRKLFKALILQILSIFNKVKSLNDITKVFQGPTRPGR